MGQHACLADAVRQSSSRGGARGARRSMRIISSVGDQATMLDGARRRRPVATLEAHAARVQAQRGHAAVVRAAREAGVVAPLQDKPSASSLRRPRAGPETDDPRGRDRPRFGPISPRVPDQHGADMSDHVATSPGAGRRPPREQTAASVLPEGDRLRPSVRVEVVVVVAVVVGLVLVGVLLQAPQASTSAA